MPLASRTHLGPYEIAKRAVAVLAAHAREKSLALTS